MRSKLLTFVIIIAVMLPLFALSALAAPTKVVDITRPEGNEIVTKEIFSICCIGMYDNTTILFEYKDKETGNYKPLLTTEGESLFKVEKNDFFGKDIQLKYKGENQIRVIAYTKATKGDPQENNYTITLAEEKKKSNWFTENITNIGDSIKKFLDLEKK